MFKLCYYFVQSVVKILHHKITNTFVKMLQTGLKHPDDHLVRAPDFGSRFPGSNSAGGEVYFITKTCLFKYNENFTTKIENFQMQILIFFMFLLKT